MLDKIWIILGIMAAVASITTAVYKYGKEACLEEVNQNNATIQTNQLTAILALPKTQEERFKCLKSLKCHL